MTSTRSLEQRLGDFTADMRVVTLTVMAAVIGVVSALVALALVRLIGLVTNLAYFHRLAWDLTSPAGSHAGPWAIPIPIVGGLIVGLMARYGSERIRGHGIPEALEAILIGRSRMSAKVAVLKPLSSALSIGTGGPFGAEGPIIMTGGAFGSLFAQAFHLSAAERKTLLDVKVLPLVFVACVAADAVTVLLMKRSILTEKVARRGHHVMREYIVSPLHQLRVADVMEKDVPTVPASLPVDTLFVHLAALDPLLARRQAWPIVDDGGRLVGMLTRGDLVLALEQVEADGQTVLEAGTRALVLTYPDELLEQATQKMLEHDIGRLPVVSREDPTRLVGYLGRAGIMAAWLHATGEERTREPGWLTEHLTILRERMAKVLAGSG